MLRYLPTFRNVARFVRGNLTRAGRALLFLLFFSTIGLVYFETTLIFLFTAVATILPLSAVLNFLYRPVVKTQLSAPAMTQAGRTLTLDLYLKNNRSRNIYELFVESKETNEAADISQVEMVTLDHIGTKQTVRTDIKFQFHHRGMHSFPMMIVGSTFPFNLFRVRQRINLNQRVIVTPEFRPLERLSLYQQDHFFESDFDKRNVLLAKTVGNSEYIGNREYQYGMPVRRWDFSSWARTGNPTVREYRESQRGNVVLVIDNFFENADQPNDLFESILSLGTAIAYEIGRQDVEVVGVVLGDEFYEIEMGSGESQFHQVAKLLATAEMKPESAFDKRLVEDALQEACFLGSTAVVVHRRSSPERDFVNEIVDEDFQVSLKVLVGKQPVNGYLHVTPKQIQTGKVVIEQ